MSFKDLQSIEINIRIDDLGQELFVDFIDDHNNERWGLFAGYADLANVVKSVATRENSQTSELEIDKIRFNNSFQLTYMTSDTLRAYNSHDREEARAIWTFLRENGFLETIESLKRRTAKV